VHYLQVVKNNYLTIAVRYTDNKNMCDKVQYNTIRRIRTIK